MNVKIVKSSIFFALLFFIATFTAKAQIYTFTPNGFTSVGSGAVTNCSGFSSANKRIVAEAYESGDFIVFSWKTANGTVLGNGQVQYAVDFSSDLCAVGGRFAGGSSPSPISSAKLYVHKDSLPVGTFDYKVFTNAYCTVCGVSPFTWVHYNTNPVTIEKTAPIVNFHPDVWRADHARQDSLFYIFSNAKYDITASSPWISLSKTRGQNNDALNVSLSENTSTQSRSGYVVLTAFGAADTLPVTQAGQPVQNTLTISPTTWSPGYSATSTTLTVTSNTSYTLSENASWLSLSSTSGTGNSTVTVGAAANTATTSRTATVTVSGGGLSQTLTVTQAGQPVQNTLTISPTTWSPGYSATSTTLTVTSNTSYTLSENASWLSLSSTSGTGNASVTVNAAANTATASRTATVTVSGGGLSQTLTVTQAGQSQYVSVQSFSAAPWQRADDSIPVTLHVNSNAATLTLEAVQNGQSQKIDFLAGSAQTVKLPPFSTTGQVSYRVFEKNNFGNSANLSGNTEITASKKQKQNLWFYNESTKRKALEFPTKYIAGATQVRVSISKPIISDQLISKGYTLVGSLMSFTIFPDNPVFSYSKTLSITGSNSNIESPYVLPGLYHIKLKYYNASGALLEEEETSFELCKYGRVNKTNASKVVVWVGGWLNATEQALFNHYGSLYSHAALNANSSASYSLALSTLKCNYWQLKQIFFHCLARG